MGIDGVLSTWGVSKHLKGGLGLEQKEHRQIEVVFLNLPCPLFQNGVSETRSHIFHNLTHSKGHVAFRFSGHFSTLLVGTLAPCAVSATVLPADME